MNTLKPYVGAMVIMSYHGKPNVYPGIITDVHSDNCANVVVFEPEGAKQYTSVMSKDSGEGVLYYAWELQKRQLAQTPDNELLEAAATAVERMIAMGERGVVALESLVELAKPDDAPAVMAANLKQHNDLIAAQGGVVFDEDKPPVFVAPRSPGPVQPPMNHPSR